MEEEFNITGFEVSESYGDFISFTSTSYVTYSLISFLTLLEHMENENYKFVCEYQENFIFKKDSSKGKQAKEEQE